MALLLTKRIFDEKRTRTFRHFGQLQDLQNILLTGVLALRLDVIRMARFEF